MFVVPFGHTSPAGHDTPDAAELVEEIVQRMIERSKRRHRHRRRRLSPEPRIGRIIVSLWPRVGAAHPGGARFSRSDPRGAGARRQPAGGAAAAIECREAGRDRSWRVPAALTGAAHGDRIRSLLVILIFFALTEPAAACRRYSIWHYDFPQPCLVVARRLKPRLRRLRRISLCPT